MRDFTSTKIIPSYISLVSTDLYFGLKMSTPFFPTHDTHILLSTPFFFPLWFFSLFLALSPLHFCICSGNICQDFLIISLSRTFRWTFLKCLSCRQLSLHSYRSIHYNKVSHKTAFLCQRIKISLHGQRSRQRLKVLYVLQLQEWINTDMWHVYRKPNILINVSLNWKKLSV